MDNDGQGYALTEFKKIRENVDCRALAGIWFDLRRKPKPLKGLDRKNKNSVVNLKGFAVYS